MRRRYDVLVVIPFTTVSESARRSRPMAAARVSAQTESLPIIGS